ncbi:hypothetical protein BGZ49_004695 [Haplosporangium sp. Z 27]|nr:hypothetical protein BGZ49_004695 [Haplosporangium sp. Z 27]
MFSWKKQNPPSQQRQDNTNDYSDLIAQGMRIANEDIHDGDDDMGDINDEDLGDIDLDDPELLAELQGLAGEAPAPKPKPSQPVAKPPAAKPAPAPAPARIAKPAATASPKPTPVTKAPPSNPTQLPSKPSSSTTPAAHSSLTNLGLDLDGVMDDDDEDVELTEDDWKDPHLLAQLQSLGGHAEHHSEAPQPAAKEAASNPVPPPKPSTQTTPVSSESAPLSPSTTKTFSEQKLKSASSSMIAIPPKDKAFDDDEDIDGDSFMAEQQQQQPEPKKLEESPAPSATKPKPQRRVEEIPQKNDKNLLQLLKTRDLQYKKAALEAGNAGNKVLAMERIKIYKTIQGWIRLVEAGGFLDLEIYPIPDEPPVSVQSAGASGSNVPSIISPASNATTHVSHGIAEASANDMRSGSGQGTSGRGVEIRKQAADDDFQIVSNSSDDTYDMLQSQLQSQINMCQTAINYYHYQAADVQTAEKFRVLQKTFAADLESLQSRRSHGKIAPAFHFQDVRFELEVFFKEVGLNELSLEIIRAWDLSHKDVQPSDIEAYVLWDLGWPTEHMAGAGTGKGSTATVKRTSKPDFNFSKILGIQRTRAFNNFAERKKVTFEVWHYRGLLWKDYPLGRAQVPLAALLQHSEIHVVVPLLDLNRRSTGGKIEVRIRLQQPLLRREIVIKEEKWLVIDEFNSGGLGYLISGLSTPAPSSQRADVAASKAKAPAGRASKVASASTTPRSSNSPAPARSAAPATKPVPSKQVAASASTSAAPSTSKALPSASKPVAPKPSVPAPAVDLEESASEKALGELNNVDLIVSNMVLESEIQQAKQMIHDAQAVANNEAVEEYQDRLSQLEIKLKLLVIRVQTGQLTMDVYCQTVNERIAKDRALAIEFKKLGMLPEAKRALSRSKIMAQEMKEVEEAMAAQGEEEEE